MTAYSEQHAFQAPQTQEQTTYPAIGYHHLIDCILWPLLTPHRCPNQWWTFSPYQQLNGHRFTLFIAHLGAQRLSTTTIEVYLAGLRFSHLLADPSCAAPSFHTTYTNLIIRGIKRVNKWKGNPTVQLPITTAMLLRIKDALTSDPLCFKNQLLWAACCTGFFGFLRCSEFMTPDVGPVEPQVHLCLSDIAYVHNTEHNHIEIVIKASKTDQFRQGTKVVLGFTGEQLYPVSALLNYLTVRGNKPGALFIKQDGLPLQRRQFGHGVQIVLQTSGAIRHFDGHSFRIGPATSASQAGVPETVIKTLGRWSSMTYKRYIRPNTTELEGSAYLHVGVTTLSITIGLYSWYCFIYRNNNFACQWHFKH